MDRAREDGDLLVAGAVERGGHRVELLQDLLVGEAPGAPLGDHRGGQGGQAFLPLGVVLRADPEDEPERDQRTGR